MKLLFLVLGVFAIVIINSCGTEIEEMDFFDKIVKLEIDRKDVCENLKDRKSILDEIKVKKDSCNYNEESATKCFSCLEKLTCEELISDDNCNSCKDICK